MITRQLSPETSVAFAEAARGRVGIYRDDEAFEDLVAASKAALDSTDPESVQLAQQFAAGLVPRGAILFRGLHIDDSAMGPTPHGALTAENEDRDPVTEAALLGLAAAAGEVFSFARQHGGALIQNVAPVAGHEFEAVGTGSRGLLDWHTEDAFDEAHAEFIGLLCVRGDENAHTALASMDAIELDPETIAILRQDRFMHGIDKASGGNGRPEDGVRGAILSGDDDSLRVRVDMDCAAAIEGDEEAAGALRRFHDAADKAKLYVTLEPGDVLLFDNRRVMHARTSFTPRYDGTDRWLQRVSITTRAHESTDRRTTHPRVVENLAAFSGA